MAHIFNGNEYNIIKHTTFEHDIRVQAFIRRNGLDSIVVDTSVDNVEEATRKIIAQMMDPAKGAPGLTLISFGLIPKGVADIAWDENIGAKIVEDLKATHEPAQKALITDLLVAVLLNFFQSGLISLKTSR